MRSTAESHTPSFYYLSTWTSLMPWVGHSPQMGTETARDWGAPAAASALRHPSPGCGGRLQSWKRSCGRRKTPPRQGGELQDTSPAPLVSGPLHFPRKRLEPRPAGSKGGSESCAGCGLRRDGRGERNTAEMTGAGKERVGWVT